MRPRNMQPPLLIPLMMLTQTIGWGSSVSLIGILAEPIRSDLDISSFALYGGTTVMFLVGAMMAPTAGRLTDRMGGLRVLCFGQPLLAAALVMLSVSGGSYGYFASWALFGLAMHLGLVTAAYNGIAQVLGREAYRAIALLTLATGLCSTIFWPLSEALLQVLNWRQLCQLYAVVILFFCTPLHFVLAWRYDRRNGDGPAQEDALSPAHVAPQIAGKAFKLLVIMQVLTGSLGTAIAILAIDMFIALGVSREAAVLAGSLLGIAYLISRGLDVLLGNRIGRMRLARYVYAALPVSLVPLLACATLGIPLPNWLAAVMAVLYGLPAGLLGVLRPSLPFHIFGSVNYGQRLGRLARPADIANGAAPAAFAWILARSPEAMMWISLGMALAAMVALLALTRMVSEGPGHRHYESVA